MNLSPSYKDKLKLLARTVSAARQTEFWRSKLGDSPVNSMSDFETLPIVAACEYRCQRFTDLVAKPDEIDWIPGPWLGQSPNRAPVAEGPTEARIRVRTLRRLLTHAVPDDIRNPAAVVATTFESRYFGAELCAVFVRMGIPAHLITDSGTDRLLELVSKFEPPIVALLSDQLDINDLPDSTKCVVTVAASDMPDHVPCLDLYVCNEFGVLGMRTDHDTYDLAHDAFYFETSPSGTLVATPYFSRVQPIVRLDTGDRIRVTSPSDLC